MVEIRYRQKNLTEEEKMRIVTDYNAGMKMRDICNFYAVSRVTVYRVLRTIVKEKEDNGS